MAGAVQPVTESDFEARIQQAHMAIVDASASWCAPCKVYAPIFERAAGQHGDIAWMKFDVDEEPRLAQRLGIQSMPTTLFFLHGKLAGKVPGALRPPQLEDLVQQLKGHGHHH
ncbi:MAG TPA: thioredoxin family protein [Candidatus Thermoplasmatota archaeon]|nr:thioredoxin family protein [Candidatus Thermoplasmatota archaeon]